MVADRRKSVAEVVEEEKHVAVKKIVRRDIIFLCIGVVVASVLGWMEVNAGDAEMRGEDAEAVVDVQKGVIDTGYIATKKLWDFLKANRGWNDFAAFVNTIVGVIGPGVYMVYETFWVGDFEPIFRYGAVSVLRSLCGWFTYLPPDPQYLMSFYDFPDIMHCIFKECGDPENAEMAPFVSFFSGHVATLVICANHMYLHGFKNLGIFMHMFNYMQIIRLLATRGHYSIDIIIGWYMAIYVSNPAGRLGRYFSRKDDLKSFEAYMMPTTAMEAFEAVIGVDSVREQRRVSLLMKREDFKNALLEAAQDEPDLAEPTAKLMTEGKLDELLATYLETAPMKEKAI